MNRKDSKKILFLSMGKWGSVASLRATNLAIGLNALGWDARLVSVGDSNTAHERTHMPEHLIVFETPKSRRGYVTSVSRYIQEFRPDFLHFLNSSLSTCAIVSRHRDLKVIGDWEDWCQWSDRRSFFGLVNHFVDRWLLRRANIRLACSRWLTNHMHEKFGLKASYLPYACHPVPIYRAENPFTAPTAVFMGNLWRTRDHRLLLEAMTLLKNQGSMPRLRIIGGGQDLEFCKALASQRGLTNVEFAGFVSEKAMFNQLAWAHVLIFPISMSTMNLARCPFKAYLYAQAGRPIITSAVGEVAAVLSDKAIYTSFTAADYARAIHEIMNVPRQPNIDYGLDQQTWQNRSFELDKILTQCDDGKRT